MTTRVAASLVILLAACGDDEGAADAGDERDAGSAVDAGMIDTGPVEIDAGPPPFDAGPPLLDSGPPLADAGPLPPDGGPRPLDAGPPPADSGPLPIDAGPRPMDGGPPPVDAGPPPIDAGPRDAGCVAIAEACNGRDDDCDGLRDETFACVAGASSACTTSCGTTGAQTCTASCTLDPACRAVEACNATDDDCDGRVDEGTVRHTLAGTTSRGERAVIVPNGVGEFGLFLIDDAGSRAWLPLPPSGDPAGRFYTPLSGGGVLSEFDAAVDTSGAWLFTALATALAEGLVIRYPLPGAGSLVDARLSTPPPGIMRIGAVTPSTAVAYHTLSMELVRSELSFAGSGGVSARATLSTTNYAFDLASSAGGDYVLHADSDGATETLQLRHCTPAGDCTATVTLASVPDPGFAPAYLFLAVWIDPAAAGVTDTTRLGVIWGQRPAAGTGMDLRLVELTSFTAAGVGPATILDTAVATGLATSIREADLVFEGGRWVAGWVDGTAASIAEIAPGGTILHAPLPFGDARQGLSLATNAGRVRLAAVYPDRVAIHRIGCR